MSKKLALLAAPVIALAASSSANSSEWGDWSSVKPYVGVDAEWRHMNFKRGYGDNVFKRNTPQGNAYVGVRLSDYFAIEAGYQAAKKKTRGSSLDYQSYFLGLPPWSFNYLQQPGDLVTFESTTKIQGPHINIVGFFPVWDEHRLELIGSIGCALLKAKLTTNLLNTSGPSIAAVANPVEPMASIDAYSKRKNVLKLGAGMQKMLTDNWGIRAMLKWENTQRIKVNGTVNTEIVPDGTLIRPVSIRYKNSMAYSLGTFLTF